MDDHKHCPFCGAPAEEGSEPPHWVRCSHQCEAGDRWMHPNAWNRRKIEDALRVLVADLYPLALVYAAEYARNHCLPDGKLHPVHQKMIDAAKAVSDEVLR